MKSVCESLAPDARVESLDGIIRCIGLSNRHFGELAYI
jgi:hypothetical protein